MRPRVRRGAGGGGRGGGGGGGGGAYGGGGTWWARPTPACGGDDAAAASETAAGAGAGAGAGTGVDLGRLDLSDDGRTDAAGSAQNPGTHTGAGGVGATDLSILSRRSEIDRTISEFTRPTSVAFLISAIAASC